MAVFSSDGVNRQGFLIPTSELMRELEVLHSRGLPSLLSHNMHRPVGWTTPRAMFFRNGTSLLLGDTSFPESDEEHKTLVRTHESHLRRNVAEAGGDGFERLESTLSDAVVGPCERIMAEGAAIINAGLARRRLPEIFESTDKNELVPLDRLRPIAPGVFKVGELCLFAHPFFRRSLSRLNAMNEELLTELQALTGREDVSGPSILLDPDMIGLASTVRRRIELQYWWGPRFSDDLLAIPEGVTRYESTERQCLFSGVSSTDFWWHARDENRTLEIEELLDVESFAVDQQPLFGCRYVHSIVDERTNVIKHLDGAIRGYGDAAMLDRLSRSIETAGRNSEYTKLWRLDGTIPLSAWKNLIHHHFRDNTLVGEYFSGADDDDTSREGDAPEGRSSHPVPFAGIDGLNLLLTLRPSSEDVPVRERELQTAMLLDGVPACSARILDWNKLLVRAGSAPLFDTDARPLMLAYEDMYADFPLIMHTSSNALDATRDVAVEWMRAWRAQEHAPIVALNFGLRGPVFDMLVGIVGCIPDVLTWLSSPNWFPRPSKLQEWADQATAACHRAGGAASHPFYLVSPNYQAEFRRVPVPEAVIDSLTVRDGNLVVAFAFPPEMVDEGRGVADGVLHARACFVIEEAACGLCGEPYAQCLHVKLVDDGVTMIVEKARMLDLYWTDAPA